MKHYFLLIFLFFQAVSSDVALQLCDIPFDIFNENICNNKQTTYSLNQLNTDFYHLISETDYYKQKLHEKSFKIAEKTIKNKMIITLKETKPKDYYHIIKFPKFKKKKLIFFTQKYVISESNRELIKKYYQEVYPGLFMEYAGYYYRNHMYNYLYDLRNVEAFYKFHPEIIDKIEKKISYDIVERHQENMTGFYVYYELKRQVFLKIITYNFIKLNKKIIFINLPKRRKCVEIDFNEHLEELCKDVGTIKRIVLMNFTWPNSINCSGQYYTKVKPKLRELKQLFKKKDVEFVYGKADIIKKA